MTPHVLFAILSCIALGANGEEIEPPRVAIAFLNAGNIVGSVTFTEVEGGVHVTGTINGLPPGKYGFHVHELGNIATCDAAGAHFNPDDTSHGGQDHEVRHVGDLGNVEFEEIEGQPSMVLATLDIVDPLISLRGRNSILGRAVVLHEQEDDLGLTSHELSSTTGNAGGRVACGVVGVHFPEGPWNSARSVGPSAALVTIALFFMHFFKS